MIRGVLRCLLRTQPHAADRRAERRRLSIAVFIDADGVSPRDADIVLDHLRCVGEVATIRWFGNQSAGQAPAWTPLIRKHGIVVRHMPALVPGKNASDVALVVDVMDHLQTGSADTYALVASDTDFTPLALRLRESRKTVLGFGSSSTPSAFRASCAAFEEIRAIDPIHIRESRKRALFWTMQPPDAEGVIIRVLAELGGDNRVVSLDQLAKRLASQGDHGFDPRIYRRRNLTELLRDLPAVHLVIEEGRRGVRLANDPRGNG